MNKEPDQADEVAHRLSELTDEKLTALTDASVAEAAAGEELGTVALTYRREMRGWRDEAQSTFEASRSGSISVRRLPVPA